MFASFIYSYTSISKSGVPTIILLLLACGRSYYSVLVGWCGYYFIHSCAYSLPENITASNATWNDLQVSALFTVVPLL